MPELILHHYDTSPFSEKVKNVAGEVVASSVYEIAVRRRDPDLGEMVVHFPRTGFRVAA